MAVQNASETSEQKICMNRTSENRLFATLYHFISAAGNDHQTPQ